jgi:DNA topoisomerase-1
MKMSTIERRRQGRKFIYVSEGKKVGRQVGKYIGSLHIPPAWADVTIDPDRSAKILARGQDEAGRTQYIYNPDFREKQDKAKFERILKFGRALPRMRRVTARHLRSRRLEHDRVLACIVRLMEQSYIRVGNDRYANDNHTYGLTTLRSKHTIVKGDTIIFDFTGKSGKEHHRVIKNRTLAGIVRRLDELPGYEVFKYYDEDGVLQDVKSDDVNAYIKRIMGEEFSAKDFRTWGATLLATAEFAKAKKINKEHARKKMVSKCIKKVAKKLGNTPAITRQSYVDPRIIATFMSGDKLADVYDTVRKLTKTSYLSNDERCVLSLLEAKT